jgi:hypothetical protein
MSTIPSTHIPVGLLLSEDRTIAASERAGTDRRSLQQDTETDDGMKFGHDTLMGAALVISAGLTVAYTRAASRTLLILTLIGAAVTLVIGVLLFFRLA